MPDACAVSITLEKDVPLPVSSSSMMAASIFFWLRFMWFFSFRFCRDLCLFDYFIDLFHSPFHVLQNLFICHRFIYFFKRCLWVLNSSVAGNIMFPGLFLFLGRFYNAAIRCNHFHCMNQCFLDFKESFIQVLIMLYCMHRAI